MEKYELIPEQLLYEGTISQESFFEPKALNSDEILSTHSPEYLEKLEGLSLSRKEIRDIGFPVDKKLVQRGKVIAHGSYECALHALKDGVSLNIAGGTHHAFADHGEGFCVFNDFGIASNLLLSRKLVRKILIVDLDVHQGNGTAALFAENEKVFTFSMHGERNYPLRKESSDLDIALPDKSDDTFYMNILQENLPRLLDEQGPDLIFYLAGVDVLESDKLGRISMTKQGCKKRDAFVFQQAKKNKVPVAVSMGGGYSVKIADIVEAHANTFRAASEIYF